MVTVQERIVIRVPPVRSSARHTAHVVEQRELHHPGAVEVRLLGGQRPDQEDEVETVLADALRLRDAAHRVTAARHAVEELKLEQGVEQVLVALHDGGGYHPEIEIRFTDLRERPDRGGPGRRMEEL